jgi:hypothetical protein
MDEHKYNKDTVGWGQRSEAAPGCNLRDLPALLWAIAEWNHQLSILTLHTSFPLMDTS